MTLASVANLAVASLDLALVRDVVGAIRAADAAGAAGRANPLTPLPTLQSPRHIHPDPIYARTRIIHPEPRYQPRMIVHPEPRSEPITARLALTDPTDNLSAAPPAATSTSTIKPPWATLPWETPAKPPARIKVVLYRTDILTKGTLLDVFI